MNPLLRHGLVSLGLALILGYATGMAAEALGYSGSAASCRTAFWVTAAADFVAFLIVRRGLGKALPRFLALWGIALLTKFACLAAASAALLAAGQVTRNEYLLALALAFMVFTTRQAASLVRHLGNNPKSSHG